MNPLTLKLNVAQFNKLLDFVAKSNYIWDVSHAWDSQNRPCAQLTETHMDTFEETPRSIYVTITEPTLDDITDIIDWNSGYALPEGCVCYEEERPRRNEYGVPIHCDDCDESSAPFEVTLVSFSKIPVFA